MMENKNSAPYKVAIIGYGKMGKNHFRVLKEDSRFVVDSILDPQLSTLQGPLLECFDQEEPFFQRIKSSKPDFCIVASATSSHLEMARRLAPLQIPFLIEKPLALNVDQAHEIFKISKDLKVPIFAGHVERFNPVIGKLREVLDSGMIGTPIHFSITRVGGYPASKNIKDNVLLDLAVHDLDLLKFLVGSVTVRSSVCHSTWQKDLYDTAEILCACENGSSASIHVNWVTPTKIRTMRVTGTKGVAFLDYVLQSCTVIGGNILDPHHNADPQFTKFIEEYKNTDRTEFGILKAEPLKIQLDHIFNFLSGKQHHLCSAEDGAKAVSLAQMAIEMGAGGRNMV